MADIVTKQTTVSVGGDKAEKSQTVEYVIYFIFGVIEVLLLFRLVLKLMGANPISGFVRFIYGLSQIFVAPFVGIFHQATAPGIETTSILEPATLVAMVVYAVLAWGITQLVVILSGKQLPE